MDKTKLNRIITLIIIVVVIAIGLYIVFRPVETPEAKVAKCIGENSIIYIQNGCSHCYDQEQLFGENFKYLTVVNCNDDGWKLCTEKKIPGTPTWVINGKQYYGVQSIAKLKELTGC